MPDLENYWSAERLSNLGRSLPKDTLWRQKASDTFPRLKSGPKADRLLKLRGEVPFVRECRKALRNFSRSSDLCRPVSGTSGGLCFSWVGTAGRWRRFACSGIGRLVQASSTTEGVDPFRLKLQSGSGRHA